MLSKLKRIYREAVRAGAFLCIDIERLKLREITFELYRRLRSDGEFRDYPHVGLAMQVYFKDADEQLEKMLAWAREESLPISIRLTKGAYWEHEVADAEENNVPAPVYTIKAETDIAFERAAGKILCNHDICRLACASHNIRSISAVKEQAVALNVGEDRYEFQVLYGMAASVRRAILEATGRVRLYCPHGELLSGMAYLVRRLLENTSNESFVHQTFDKTIDRNRLLEDPKITLARFS
jgi:RHH-type proline utilization regulon transcriptional repressor/proline dehydrogenase/delta 1-pyrroline-5-carboxylate dehydrogenase